ncbi:MAG: adenylosuccinate lyase, partial [Bdellovibrionales bacterium]|nr:adenylosuccinate lyase [Bdellovibrionales bacterium]
ILNANVEIDIEEIEKIEATTRHDVIAFVTFAAAKIGESGRYLHFGLTSSDVLDTALSLQLRKSALMLNVGFKKLETTLAVMVEKYSDTLCAGRTHGMHAEITSFGYKMASSLEEFQRAHARVKQAFREAQVVKLSGPVGTYSTQAEMLEIGVAKELGLSREPVATQVIPRDRLAAVGAALGIWAGAVERMAVELRHLQRTEVSEVEEGFAAGQKGSSAMPHKKNPISAENLTGLCRLIRSQVVPLMENIALWHERDISHSSVERVILPDLFILTDYATHRLNSLLSGLVIKESQMLKNIELSQGRLMSSQILLALIETGLSREKAYELVQKAAMSLGNGESLKEKCLQSKEIMASLKPEEVKDIFEGKEMKTHLAQLCRASVARWKEHGGAN